MFTGVRSSVEVAVRGIVVDRVAIHDTVNLALSNLLGDLSASDP